MSFEEKSTALMLGVIVVIYGWYFALVGSRLLDAPAQEVSYKAAMSVTVVALVALAIVGHILIAAAAPKDVGPSDERDTLIDLRGEWIGGHVLGTGAVAGLFLALAEVDFFWIANALLLAMVLSEAVTSIAKLALYRRMA